MWKQTRDQYYERYISACAFIRETIASSDEGASRNVRPKYWPFTPPSKTSTIISVALERKRFFFGYFQICTHPIPVRHAIYVHRGQTFPSPHILSLTQLKTSLFQADRIIYIGKSFVSIYPVPAAVFKTFSLPTWYCTSRPSCENQSWHRSPNYFSC